MPGMPAQLHELDGREFYVEVEDASSPPGGLAVCITACSVLWRGTLSLEQLFARA